jgi:CheY-like chemotaxis protein
MGPLSRPSRDRIAPCLGRHQKRFAPKYRYQGIPRGCILASAMDEIKRTEKLAASQVQLLCQGIDSGVGGGLVVSEESGVAVIAVVDDDESVRQSLQGFFESVGYEVALFSSAEEFARSGCHREDLRCLILDVRLPGMSGFELYLRLTLSGRSIPVIFITAHQDPSIAAWAAKPGVVKLLYKPFQPGILLEAVRSALAMLH